MANTPNMNLERIETTEIQTLELIRIFNANMAVIDNHIHTLGQGKSVPLSALLADSDLIMGANNIRNIRGSSFVSSAVDSLLNASCFFKNGEFFIRDGSGRVVQLTQNGAVAEHTSPLIQGFVNLTDTPNSYTGEAGKTLRVNTAMNALEFVALTFLSLADAPDSYTNQQLKFLRVNAQGTGLEFADSTGGFNFNSPAALAHEAITFPVYQRGIDTRSFVPGVSPDTGLGNRVVSRLFGTQAAVGTGGDSLPADVALMSESRLVYQPNPSLTVRNIWVDGVEHSVDSIKIPAQLGGIDVEFSHISPELPAGDWNNAKFEFSDGTFEPSTTGVQVLERTLNKAGLLDFLDLEEFNPSKENLYNSVKAILKAGSGVTITPSDSARELTISANIPQAVTGRFIALENQPTDLSVFAKNQIIGVASQDRMYFVKENTASGHAIRAVMATRGGNRFGFNLTIDPPSGSAGYVEGGSLDQEASPVGELEFETTPDVQGNYAVDVLIQEDKILADDRSLNQIILGAYASEPSESSFTDAIPISRGTNVTRNGIVYRTFSANITQVRLQNLQSLAALSSNVLYFEFYSAFTTFSNNTVFDLFMERELEAFSQEDTAREISTKLQGLAGNNKLPASAIGVNSQGFDGNLAVTDDDLQKVAQKLDDLVIDVSPDGLSGARKIGTWSNLTASGITNNNEIPDGTLTLESGVNSAKYKRIPVTNADLLEIFTDVDVDTALLGYLFVAKNSSGDIISYTRWLVGNYSEETNSAGSNRHEADYVFLPFESNSSIKIQCLSQNNRRGYFILRGSSPSIPAGTTVEIYQYKGSAGSGSVPSNGGGGGALEGHLFEANTSLAAVATAQGTEQRISITARAGETETGITVANNELTFVSAGVYSIDATLRVQVTADPSDTSGPNNTPNQNSRHLLEGYAKLVRGQSTSIVAESRASQYIRGSNRATVAGTSANWGQADLHVSFAFEAEAGDKLQLFMLPLAKQVANNQYSLAPDSVIEAVWYSGGAGGVGGVSNTPRRLSTIPTNVLEDDRIFITEDYSKDNGVDISPDNFTGTELDPVENSDVQAGVGNRGWYNKRYAGFDVGYIHPDLPEDFVLISDARVYVRRSRRVTDGEDNLRRLYIGGNFWNLTLVPQNAGTKIINSPEVAGTEPDVDYYTIDTSTTPLPSGAWKDLRFDTAPNVFIPTSLTVLKGEYTGRSGIYQRSGFYAPPASPNRGLIFKVEEIIPGAKQDKAVAFNSNGQAGAALLYSKTNPISEYPDILRITFYPSTYGTSAEDQTNRNRYAVFVSTSNFVDDKTPTKIEIGSNQYPLFYYETDAGQAVYRSAVIPSGNSGDYVSTDGETKNINVQTADAHWAAQSGEKKNLRTLSADEVGNFANTIQSVHSLPNNPREGQRIEALEDITIGGSAVFKPAEAGSHENWGWSADLGSLIPAPPANSIDFILAYQVGNPAVLNNRVTVWRSNGNTRTPSKMFVNGRSYPLTRSAFGSQLPHAWYATGLTPSDIQVGREYAFNLEYADGSKLYEDVVIRTGEIWVYTGIMWSKEAKGQTADEVRGIIRNQIPQQFRADADVSGQRVQPSEFWVGTQAQIDAYTRKVGGVYFVID